ncbi:hypothetical protein DIPPA_30992 [Diplonema papillatum]|nr:hypothetical protein DIPPA_30992 [Diplonema papillatum]
MDVSSMYSGSLASEQRAPRVGGGYATQHQLGHHAYKYVDALVKSEIQPLRPSQCLVLEGFNADNALCLCVVHGGASIWTGESDGSLVVRNPYTGVVFHSVGRDEGYNPRILKLLPWGFRSLVAATEDGSLEFFDHFDGSRIKKHLRHNSAVLDFAEGVIDQKPCLYSICSAVVTRWGSEEQGMEPLASTHIPDMCLSCAAAHEEKLFLGNTEGTVSFYDGSTLALIGKWCAHPEASVTALLYYNHFLVSGGSEGLLNIWRGQSTEGAFLLHTHENLHDSPIRSLHANEGCNQVWSADETKVVRWACSMDTNPPFAIQESGALIGSADGLLGLSLFTQWMGMRSWSLGSNGKNCTWFTARSVAIEQMSVAVHELNFVNQQEVDEMTKWQTATDNIVSAEVTRRERMSQQLASFNDAGTRWNMFRKWRTWSKWRRARTQQPLIAPHFERVKLRALISRYYDSWARYALFRRNWRASWRCSQFLLTKRSDLALLRRYWRNLNTTRYRKLHRMGANIQIGLLANTTYAILNTYYRRLQAFKATKIIDAKDLAYAARLGVSNTKMYLQFWFHRWLRHHVTRIRARDVERDTFYLTRSNHTIHRHDAYRRWRDFAACARRNHRMGALVLTILRPNQNSLRSLCLSKLKAYMYKSKDDALARGFKGADAKLEELRKEQTRLDFLDLHEDEQRLVEKIRVVQEKKEELEMAIRLQETRIAMKLDHLKRTKEVGKTIRQQFFDIMAKLKELSLNFEADRDMIKKITEKCKVGKPFRVFLEAHMEIKSVVVRLSGISDLGIRDLWPMKIILAKVAPHELRKLHAGVKTMVIAFDMLTQTDMELLDTDGEVVLNGANLIELYKHSKKASTRAK